MGGKKHKGGGKQKGYKQTHYTQALPREEYKYEDDAELVKTSKAWNGLRGLQNLGNTCFFNSIVQNLVQTVPLRTHLVPRDPFNPTEVANRGKAAEAAVSAALRTTLVQMWLSEGRNYNPRPLLNAVSSKVTRFQGGRQQDAHELLRFLLDQIDTEVLDFLNKFKKTMLDKPMVAPAVPTASESSPEKEGENTSAAQSANQAPSAPLTTSNQSPGVYTLDFFIEKTRGNLTVNPYYNQTKIEKIDKSSLISYVEHIFGGRIESTLICHSCGTTSSTYETFFDLSLPIPPRFLDERTKRAIGLIADTKSKKKEDRQATKSAFAVLEPETTEPEEEEASTQFESRPAQEYETMDSMGRDSSTPNKKNKNKKDKEETKPPVVPAKPLSARDQRLAELQAKTAAKAAASPTKPAVAPTPPKKSAKKLKPKDRKRLAAKMQALHHTVPTEDDDDDDEQEDVAEGQVDVSTMTSAQLVEAALVMDDDSEGAVPKVEPGANPGETQRVQVEGESARDVKSESDGKGEEGASASVVEAKEGNYGQVLGAVVEDSDGRAEGTEAAEASPLLPASLTPVPVPTSPSSNSDTTLQDTETSSLESSELHPNKPDTELLTATEQSPSQDSSVHASTPTESPSSTLHDTAHISDAAAEPASTDSHHASTLDPITVSASIGVRHASTADSPSSLVSEPILSSSTLDSDTSHSETKVPNGQEAHSQEAPNTTSISDAGRDSQAPSIPPKPTRSLKTDIRTVQPPKELDLNACLYEFTEPEILSGPNAYGCYECTKRRWIKEGRDLATLIVQYGTPEEKATLTVGELAAAELEIEGTPTNASNSPSDSDSEQDSSTTLTTDTEALNGDVSEHASNAEESSIKLTDGTTTPATNGDDVSSAPSSPTKESEPAQENGVSEPSTANSEEEEKKAKKSNPSPIPPKKPELAKKSEDTKNKKSAGISLDRSTATKQILIDEVPQVLTLHLKRFWVTMSGAAKIDNRVEFPTTLDIAPYLSRSAKERYSSPQHAAQRPLNLDSVLYQLYGIVVHSGGMSSGHYVAYTRRRENPISDKTSLDDIKKDWHYFSDTSMSPVNLDTVLSQQAYILFYERVSD